MESFGDNTATSAGEQEELGDLGEELRTKSGQVNMKGLSLEDRQEIEEVDHKGKY